MLRMEDNRIAGLAFADRLSHTNRQTQRIEEVLYHAT
jgi:hypothetical protein